ncbi:MAG: DEAD/DEAH box helicase [Candidatus Nanoarchaeia archaeon]|nr:DEAD/DEAH box helicase [Candidatus Nanoarchaeia archaeon]
MNNLPRIINEMLERKGIKELRPPQQLALDKGLMEGKNIVISSPTGSGKTLAAEIAMVNHFEKKQKTLYVVPLKSLASEKYKSFKEDYSNYGLKVGVSISDYDSQDYKLKEYDIIISTAEKVDSLIRHNAGFIREVSCVIIDEIHLIDDYSRGPTLEVLITILKKLLPKAQIIALSATISNDSEISKWLNAELVKSDYRAVKLYEGVYMEGLLEFNNNKTLKIESSSFPEKDIAMNTLNINKQLIFFLGSRRNAQSLGNRLSAYAVKSLNSEDKGELDILADKILYSLEQPTEQCNLLSECVRKGVAFHHAGLMQKQKDLVEKGFKDRLIKIICATPTLCLHKDTLIWNGINETKVSDFDINKDIYALNKNKLFSLKPKKIIKLDNLNKIIEITSVSENKIKITANHKMLIKRNNSRLIIPAEEITKNDKIATVGRLKINKKIDFLINDFVKHNILNKKYSFNSNVAYLVGAMLGDGYSGAETLKNDIKYKSSPCIVGKDNEVFLKIKETCKYLDISYRDSCNSYNIPQLVLGKNNWFREFLLNCGIEKGENKYINANFMNMNEKNISELLKGLFDTDGCVNKNKDIEYSSISFLLIKCIQKLLLIFGIVCRIRERDAKLSKINGRECKSKKYFELIICQNKCIIEFYKKIGFCIERKQKLLIDLVNKINSNNNYYHCKKCNYKIYNDLFSGRSENHKKWGEQKVEVIKKLGENNELGSRELKKLIGYEPKKKDLRLNHHYELIKKRKIGKLSNTEWYWKLNDIGLWFYKNILIKNKNIDEFFKLNNCPLCNEVFLKKLKNSWRCSDFEEDIFWDVIKKIETANCSNEKVYDVVLPDKPANNHLFVANGFIVHNSAGINLPAFRVVVRDLKRFSALQGSYYIPVLEVKQMFGRAGRPGMEDYGEAITLAKSENEKKEIFDEYIYGDVENVYSKLSSEPHLRTHVLSLVSNNFCHSIVELKEFFKNTFFAIQYKNLDEINRIIGKITDELIFYGFIDKKNDLLAATLLGKRVSELYLDPLVAYNIINGIMKSKSIEMNSFNLLQCLCYSKGINMLNIKNLEVMNILELAQKNFLLIDEPSSFDYEYDDFLKSIKTAMLFESWINEINEQQIIDEYKIYPGDLRNLLSSLDWLIYSMAEMAKIIDEKKCLGFLKRMRIRISYGIKDELFELVSIKGIGRVRARKLFAKNIKSVGDILKTSYEILSEIIGPGVAKKIKNI